MSCAHDFDEWCKECIDGVVQQYNTVRRDLASITAERDALREKEHAIRIAFSDFRIALRDDVVGGGITSAEVMEAAKRLKAERDALREELAKANAMKLNLASVLNMDERKSRELAEARAEMARLTQASQWQPIDRMPQHKRVLFTYQIGVGNWAEPCIIDWSIAYRHGYWMPLPAPPANGESR